MATLVNIENACDFIMGRFLAANASDKNLTEAEQRSQVEVYHAAAFLVKTVLIDLHRIADAQEKLAKGDGIPGFR